MDIERVPIAVVIFEPYIWGTLRILIVPDHPTRISRIERAIRHIRIQIHLVRIPNRIGLQKPSDLRPVIAGPIVVELALRIIPATGIAEGVAGGVERRLDAIGRVDIAIAQGAAGIGQGDDREKRYVSPIISREKRYVSPIISVLHFTLKGHLTHSFDSIHDSQLA